MKFTARWPSVMLFALRISFISASRDILSYSFFEASTSPRPILEIVPIPPSFATAEDSEASETLTPIPPWRIGISAVILPILSFGIFICCYFFFNN
ncbi:hypothetical protein ES705_47438 [subsurface metagenome]